MFIKQFIEAFTKARQEYKQFKLDQKAKNELLSARSDFHLLERFIQAVNKNPDLRIEVRLNDGTVLLLKTYKSPEKKTTSQLIDGDVGEWEGNTYRVR